MNKFFIVDIFIMVANVPVFGNIDVLMAAFVSTVNELCGKREHGYCIISPNI